MPLGSVPTHIGGCQCGAVRYALYGTPYGAHVCHCRMRQKAFGSPFAALFLIKHGEFAWTQGAPATFRSSALAERGFCRDCGTPLVFQYLGRDYVDLAIASLDRPAEVAPERQFGLESRLPWLDRLHGLPGSRTADDMPAELLARLDSRQHPDR